MKRLVAVAGLCFAGGCTGGPSVRDDAGDVIASDAVDAPADTGPSDSGIRDLTYTPPPHATTVEPGVRREVFTVAAPAAPANPTTHAMTPAAQNSIQVVRYRQDLATPAPVQAVVVAMPGFLGGAGSFDPLARALVKRGAMDGHAVEVWAIDRRANQLEDLRGMDAAEALHDPEAAVGYYLRRDTTLNGERFAGFIDARDTAYSYLSEWGLPTTLADLDTVISSIPQSRDHVILVGHSLGASIVEAYAAWDFAGTPGSQKIAGLVLIDGVLQGPPSTEDEYYMGRTGGGIPSPGVTAVRSTGPFYFALPLIGVRATVVSEIVARRAIVDPDAVVVDPYRDNLFRTLLAIPATPPLSNAAALGFALDDNSCPLAFAAMSLGAPIGAVRMQPNPFGMGGPITVPANATDTYRWTDATMTTPPEFTTIANAAHAWAATPTNFSEWYFATRLTVDAAALPTTLQVVDGSYQAREGFHATHGGEIDVPFLGVSAALTGSASVFDGVRSVLTAAVGTGRPNAGATRTTDAGFRAFFVPGMSHIDPLSGLDDGTRNPVPGAVEQFADGNTAGTITIPVR